MVLVLVRQSSLLFFRTALSPSCVPVLIFCERQFSCRRVGRIIKMPEHLLGVEAAKEGTASQPIAVTSDRPAPVPRESGVGGDEEAHCGSGPSLDRSRLMSGPVGAALGSACGTQKATSLLKKVGEGRGVGPGEHSRAFNKSSVVKTCVESLCKLWLRENCTSIVSHPKVTVAANRL